MAPRRIVQDSDDEGSDFSPVQSPFSPPTININIVDTDSDTPNQKSSRSTDPSFFRRVYEEQLNGIAGGSVSVQDSATPNHVRSSESDRLAQERGDDASSNTDPMKDGLRGPADTTTGATPDKPSDPSHNPWDVPSSGEIAIRGGGKTGSNSETYGKRKQGQRSSQPGPRSTDALGLSDTFDDAPVDLPGDLNMSPIPPRKRRKRDIKQSSNSEEHDIELVLVPRSEEASKSSGAKASSGNPSSIVYDTLVGETPQRVLEVSIAQNRMTSSQRKEYKSLSSSGDSEAGHNVSLPGDFPQPAEYQKSSAAHTMSTVAYTTPSQFASSESRRTGEPKSSVPKSDRAKPSKRKRSISGTDHPSSSPDIITEPNAASKKTKPSSHAPQDNSWDSEEIGFHREAYNPRPSRRKSARDESMPAPNPGPNPPETSESLLSSRAQSRALANLLAIAGDEPILIGSSPPVHKVEPPKTQKKRGRKKKEVCPPENTDAVQQPASEPTDHVEAPVEKPKKKRGRPKKSDAQKQTAATDRVPVQEEAGLEPAVDVRNDPEQAPSVSPKPSSPLKSIKERGNKKTAISELPSSGNASKVLSEKSDNLISSLPSSLGEKATPTPATQQSEGKENQGGSKTELSKGRVKELDKARSNGEQAGKVAYRVGLSKRSRIAPLLKSLRK